MGDPVNKGTQAEITQGREGHGAEDYPEPTEDMNGDTATLQTRCQESGGRGRTTKHKYTGTGHGQVGCKQDRRQRDNTRLTRTTEQNEEETG